MLTFALKVIRGDLNARILPRLCFSTGIERLAEMVETRAVVPSFPALNYTYEHSGPTATAEVEASRIQAFHIGGFLDHKNTG